MFDDSPIDSIINDKLNRKNFVKSIANSLKNIPNHQNSIVIGLMGGWGSGKSSLLNLVENEVENEIQIIRFNPWNYDTKQSLFMAYFDELTNYFSFNDIIKLKIQKYKNKIIAKGINMTTSAISPKLSTNISLDENTLSDIKDELNKLFKNQSKTIVIIDDIDRLNPNEVKEIFQLVKSLANFPNLIYILAFDKNYVNHALKEWNIENKNYSEEFIDKIIQVPLTIPKFHDEDIKNIFKTKFNQTILNHDIELNNEDISKLYTFLHPFFKNIRDINRYCNSLDFYLYAVGCEVWIYDFALVSALEIFAKDVYDEIKYNKDLLAGFYNPNEDENSLEYFLNTLFENTSSDDIKNILKELFAKVNSLYSDDNLLNIKHGEYSIMETEHFDMYFTFENTNYLSKSRILSITKSAEEDINLLKENIMAIKKRELLLPLFDKLQFQYNNFTENAFENLTTLFIKDYKELFGDDNTVFMKALFLIIKLINAKSLNEKYIVKILDKFEYNPFKTTLIYEMINAKYFKKESMKRFKYEISTFINDYLSSDSFKKLDHPRTLIWIWMKFEGFESVNSFCKQLSDEDLISLVKAFVKENRIQYDYIKRIVDMDYLKNRLKNLEKRDEICDMFLKYYPN